jgi:hypothetical protein
VAEAEQVWRVAAAAGDPDARAGLAWELREQGRDEELRRESAAPMIRAMSLLPRRSRPTADPAAPYPELRGLHNAMRAGEWSVLREFFGRAVDWDDAIAGAWAVADADESEEFLAAVVAAEPAEHLARVLLAGALISRGWRIRTRRRSESVSREQFEAFHDFLRRAEILLIESTARDRTNVLAWTFRLAVARGLELGQEEGRRRYERAATGHSNVLGLQRQLLQHLSPKWSGSPTQMHEFAQKCTDDSSAGSPNAVLVVEAHLENWLHRDGDLAYLYRADVADEVERAARHSVLHPDFHSRFDWVRVHNTFAMFYCLTGDYRSAIHHFKIIGDFVSKEPWLYLGDPVKHFIQQREEAYLRVGP